MVGTSQWLKVLITAWFLSFGDAGVAAEATVKVHLLDHTDLAKPEARFWIDWSKKWRGIVTSETVSGERAEEVIAMLRRSLIAEEQTHFCGHDPIYGIEATAEDGKALKTSLCFTCLTWVKPGKRLRIAGNAGAENDLCVMLRMIVELPEDLRGGSESGAVDQGEP